MSTTTEPTNERHFVTLDVSARFAMIEDESGDVFWGYGHRDATEFITEVNRWLEHMGVGSYALPDGTPIEHRWARLDNEHGDRFSLVDESADDAFPVTRVMA